MRVAFYAPLKAPAHPVPSGDRAIARLLLAALERAGATRGWEVDVASRFRSFDGAGDADRQARLRAIGARIADRLLHRYREAPAGRRPDLWFTYHLYHKAPDWIGPVVSERLGIPYLVAEASYAAKQRSGPWSVGHEAAAEAIRHADAILALNRDDVAGVRQVARDRSRIVVLPPFLGPRGGVADESRCDRGPALAEDGEGSPGPSVLGPRGVVADESRCGRGPALAADGEGSPGPSRRSPPPATAGAHAASGRAGARAAVSRRFGVPDDEPWLLCVAMMRGGRKLASFEMLADALARPALAAARWHLVVAGEGPARREVESAFAGRLPAGRVTFTGRVEGAALAGLYAGADLFVWPAVGEPMGMAMLEAQGRGLPVVSARTRGVPDLVRDEETGVLVPEGDAGAFADAVRALLRAPGRCRRMGDAARARVAREHGFEAASDRIGDLVENLIRRGGRAGAPPGPNPVPAADGGRARAPVSGLDSESGPESKAAKAPEPARADAPTRAASPARSASPVRAGGA